MPEVLIMLITFWPIKKNKSTRKRRRKPTIDLDLSLDKSLMGFECQPNCEGRPYLFGLDIWLSAVTRHMRAETEEVRENVATLLRSRMLKFLSKVRIEFNALDPRTAACMEFLAQCNARKAKESNPACQLLVKRRTDDHPPQITVTFVNGVEEVFDATSTPAQTIRTMILEKGQMLETEQMFRDAGERWPVIIPEEELRQPAPGTKPRKAEEKKQ